MGGNLYIGTSTDAYATSSPAALSITNAGNVGIGTTNPTPSNKDATTPLFVVSGSDVAGSAQVVRHTSVGVGGAFLNLSATRGTDATSYTILQNADGIGTLSFKGADGGEFVGGASIQANVDGTPGDNDMPGRLTFLTTADGASTPTERMRIDSSGNVGIGTTSPSAMLSVLSTGNASSEGLVYFDNRSGSQNRTLKLGDSTNSSSRYLLQAFNDTDGDTGGPNAVFSIRSDGNVGIGTTGPL